MKQEQVTVLISDFWPNFTLFIWLRGYFQICSSAINVKLIVALYSNIQFFSHMMHMSFLNVFLSNNNMKINSMILHIWLCLLLDFQYLLHYIQAIFLVSCWHNFFSKFAPINHTFTEFHHYISWNFFGTFTISSDFHNHISWKFQGIFSFYCLSALHFLLVMGDFHQFLQTFNINFLNFFLWISSFFFKQTFNITFLNFFGGVIHLFFSEFHGFFFFN